MFQNINSAELSIENLIKKKKGYKSYLITFAIIFIILIIALLYGSMYRNHSIVTFQNAFVVLMMLSFIISNYVNLRKINNEILTRKKNDGEFL